MKVQNFRELRVWQHAIDLAFQVYQVTAKFPKDEIYGLTSQLRRAAVSIPSNLAEGAERKSKKEFLYFISNAQRSLAEVETQIIIAQRLEYISSALAAEIFESITSLTKQLHALSASLKTQSQNSQN